ncbi:MAG: ATP-binding protein, partial [Bacteroidales bacterium]|nr:ATP-binding protein [Bacteroidales bacterium]
RTPMNAILGFSETLQHQIEDPLHQKMLESIYSSGKLLLALLNDILDLSKIEAGKLEIVQQPTDLSAIINEMKLLFRDKANEKNIDIRIRKQHNFPDRMLLDEARVKQVLFNLVGNAVKFTHEGHVTISAEFIKEAENNGTLSFQVADTGIGIPAAHQEMIFKPFHQQSGKLTRSYEGTGLGLAISRRLIEKMNGNISLKSMPGKGSTFRVTIPYVQILDRDHEPTIRKKATPEMLRFEKAIILIVDDSPTNIQLLEAMVDNSGLEVLTALSGEEALMLLKKQQPDLIILDLLMPGMDGYETAKKIKEDPSLEHIPLIAFTAFTQGERQQAPGTLFDKFLYKPVSKQYLFDMLKSFLTYSIINTTKKAQTSDKPRKQAFDPKTLTSEARTKIPELVELLESGFLPEWNKIKDQFVIFKIEDFALRLQNTAKEYQVEYLEAYAQQILFAIDSLDLELIKSEMKMFPEILKEIKQ